MKFYSKNIIEKKFAYEIVCKIDHSKKNTMASNPTNQINDIDQIPKSSLLCKTRVGKMWE